MVWLLEACGVFLKTSEQSIVLGIAWCLSLTGLVFVMITVIVGAMSMGAGMDPLLGNVLSALSILLGVHWGIRQERRHRPTKIADTPDGQNRRKGTT